MPLTEPQAPKVLIIHTDGGSRGNPGPAATGIVVYTQKLETVHSFGKYIGVATNNVAEYTAVLHAIEWLNHSGLSPESILFKLDSTLVVEQLSGHWKIKDPNLASLAKQIKDLTSSSHLLTSFSYVPRAQNAAADYQVNLALDAALSKKD